MNGNYVEDEKNLTSALITALALLKEPPTKDVITEKARSLAEVFGFEGNLEPIISEAMIAVDSRMGRGVSLVDAEAEHDEEWVKRKDIEWVYSDAYEKYLKTQRWYPTMVQSLSDVSSRILGHLQDPTSEGSWNRRGLVIGHVQSGKTANYIGLIARAADAGYKFIIVIAGIHNNLRKQTQERIDEGFIGRSSDPNNRVVAGVGLNGNYPHPATLTNIHEDFNKNTAEKSGWRINDFSKPIILVIKKHVRTLEALHKWLKVLNTHRDGRISDVPMLLIDDEADNASINTNKPDLDPTRTNALIRKILGLFAKSCYLGYTATPFANIFINPDAYDEDAREELFPRDFIYCLDAPNTYFGPDKVFRDDTTSSNIVEAIDDCEGYISWSHKKDDPIMELPPSLYRALHQFVLARAIRNLRGQSGRHCSMMINVSRFVAVQKAIRDLISLYEKKLREAVKANYAMPEEISGQNRYMLRLKDDFESDFTDCGFTWLQIRKSLWSVFDNLRIYVANSKTDEALDYKKYEKDGHSLTAIAIGGLSLSRGLTIEGLCVSYMYRNTRMYDTLMQMGRWFGYRPDYEDLCRVHLSPDSINWYSHIADASEELRQQIKKMRRDRLSPRQFGLYVRAHPDSLLITAANKMRDAKRIVVRQNFTGKLKESHVLPTDDDVNRKNENLITEYWKNGFGGAVEEQTEKGWIFRDVDVEFIEEFLNAFHTHPAFADTKSAVVSYLLALAEKHPVGDVLLISTNNNHTERFRLGVQKRSSRAWADDIWRLNKQRVASRGDEKLGLTQEQRELAEKAPGNDPSDRDFREVRNKPLLMIHVLEPIGREGTRVPAFGLSFPDGHYGTEIEVVANRVWIEKMYGPLADDPDSDEDYDE
ncbi:MAG: Z1 domain-containing protein [Methylococcales bacterium]